MRKLSRVFAITLCLPLLMDARLMAVPWIISQPTTPQTFTTTTVIPGSGWADPQQAGQSGVFAFGTYTTDSNGDVYLSPEQSAFVTAVLVMPGVCTWTTSSGDLAPPGAWTQSPLNGQGVPIPDHATRVIAPPNNNSIAIKRSYTVQ